MPGSRIPTHAFVFSLFFNTGCKIRNATTVVEYHNMIITVLVGVDYSTTVLQLVIIRCSLFVITTFNNRCRLDSTSQ